MTGQMSFATLEQLLAHFHSEESCVNEVYRRKWPQGFVCPRCGHREAYTVRSRRLPLYECRSCRHQCSLIAGTVMEGSRTALRKWLAAIWLISRTDKGINAVQLSSLIQVTYKTAWAMLHKLRAVMSAADAERPLDQDVRAALTSYGPPFTPLFELHPKEHPFLIAASMNNPDNIPIYVKMKLVIREHLSYKSLVSAGRGAFVSQHVSCHASNIDIMNHPFRFRRPNALRYIADQAKAWINNTFHGLGGTYLQAYLDEYCYRYNLESQNVSIWERLADHCLSISTALSWRCRGRSGRMAFAA
ncbi:transposase [Paenibacillus sp. OSY-SE]|uniref:transposase n=1 Tax=Paenibacillus sp. OSY-SE TaxID=1196323 RepID=UPI0002F872C8|nr:transposase [Paenibacillus sp. OSY-SE]